MIYNIKYLSFQKQNVEQLQSRCIVYTDRRLIYDCLLFNQIKPTRILISDLLQGFYNIQIQMIIIIIKTIK